MYPGKFRVLPRSLNAAGAISMGSSVKVGYTWRLSDQLMACHTKHDGGGVCNRLYTLHPGSRVYEFRGGTRLTGHVTTVINRHGISPKQMNRIYADETGKWIATCWIKKYRNGSYHNWKTLVRYVIDR